MELKIPVDIPKSKNKSIFIIIIFVVSVSLSVVFIPGATLILILFIVLSYGYGVYWSFFGFQKLKVSKEHLEVIYWSQLPFVKKSFIVQKSKIKGVVVTKDYNPVLTYRSTFIDQGIEGSGRIRIEYWNSEKKQKAFYFCPTKDEKMIQDALTFLNEQIKL